MIYADNIDKIAVMGFLNQINAPVIKYKCVGKIFAKVNEEIFMLP